MYTRTNQVMPVIAAGLVISLTAASDGNITLQKMDGWPYAGAQAIALDTDRELAFLSSGGAVLILDIADPASPQLFHDGLHTEGHVRDLRYVAEDQRLYIADWSGGLEIWDVSTIDVPRRLSAVPVYYIGTDSDQPTDGLVIVGDYLYINANEARVHAFDISNPMNPVDLDVQAGPLWYDHYDRDTDDVAYADGYVYVAGDGIAKYQMLGDGTLHKTGEYLNTSSVTCIEVESSYAYAGAPGALGIFDVSYSYPSMVGSTPVSGGLDDLALLEDMVVAVNNDGLFVFDVSDPEQPQQIGFLSLLNGYRVRLDGNTAFVAGDADGLYVVDITDPTEPMLIGGYDTVASCATATVAGDYAFLGQVYGDLVITDVADPDACQFVAQADGGSANNGVLIGDYYYVTDWYAQALRVIDVSDIDNPVDVGGVFDFYAARVTTDGERLYVLRFNIDTQLFYLHVFGLDDPTSPVELSTMTVGPYIFEMVYGKGHLFAMEFYDVGMHIINVEDPYNPQEVKVYPLDWGEDVWIEGDRAYVTAFHDGLLILDITDPADPVLLGGIYEPFQFDSIAASGDLAFATTGLSTNVLHLYDVSNPANILEIDSVELPGEAWDLTVQGTYAYVADGFCGLQIVNAAGAELCDEDVNGDDSVDIDDLFQVLSAWGPCYDCPEDLNFDGQVDIDDVFAVLSAWGPCP